MVPKKDKLHFQGVWETYPAPATSAPGTQSRVTTSLPSWEPQAGAEVAGTQLAPPRNIWWEQESWINAVSEKHSTHLLKNEFHQLLYLKDNLMFSLSFS